MLGYERTWVDLKELPDRPGLGLQEPEAVAFPGSIQWPEEFTHETSDEVGFEKRHSKAVPK
jgi:hypothetical protein